MPQTLLQIAWLVLGLAWVILITFAIFRIVSNKAKKDKLALHVANLKWVTLELKIPKENLKTPKAMEQVFASLHALGADDWLAIEIAGFSHSTHFFVRVPEEYRNLIEASVFSQYPNAEVAVADDYVDRFGVDLPDQTYDLAGAELMLARESAYPIRTYPSFDGLRIEEEQYLDPIATIAEVMSNLKDDEMVWLQITLRPLGNDKFDAWKKEVQEVLDELLGRKPKQEKLSFFKWLGKELAPFLKNLALAPIQPPVWSGAEEKKEEKPQGKQFSYGENEIIKAIEGKVAKFAFECGIRVLYIDRRDAFSKSNVSTVVGALRQFGAPHLNSFKLDDPKLTFLESRFRKDATELANKKKLFQDYRGRVMPSKPFVLNVEELATLYHPPHSTVGAEKLARLSMRKGGPPPDLPVISN